MDIFCFLIIIFKDEKGYLLKVFLQREAVYQFPFDAPDAKIEMVEQPPDKSFGKFIETAKEWILKNY